VKDEEKKALAIYDRGLLDSTEVQPVKIVDGYVITVNTRGTFAAKVGEVDVATDTLEKAEEKVHAAYMRQQQKKRARVGKNCFAVGGTAYQRKRGEALLGVCFFRGVHAGNGDLQFRKLDGSKVRVGDAAVFPLDHKDVGEIERLVKREADLEANLAAVRKGLDELVDAQKDIMLAGMEDHGLRAPSYGRFPKIQNDADRALVLTELIVENVFGGPEK